MKYRDIGELKSASRIALGCMRMADVSEERALQVINSSYESGINFFDHADIYGSGRAEEVFGTALSKSGINRDTLYIQTKCSIKPNSYDSSYDHIIGSVDASLKRLKTDYLDSLLLHRPDALIEPDEVDRAFTELKESGKVRNFGVSNYRASQLKMLASKVHQPLVINQVQFSLMHTLLLDSGLNINIDNECAIDRDGEILDYAMTHDITLQAWSPLQYGMFKGNFVGNPKFNEVNDVLEKFAEKYGVSSSGIAIAWIQRLPVNFQTIIGSMNQEHILDLVKASDIVLTRDEWYELYLSTGKQLP